MVGRSYNLSRVKGRLFEDSIIGGRAINDQERNVFNALLRIITNRNGQRDCTKGIHFSSFEPDEGGVGQD